MQCQGIGELWNHYFHNKSYFDAFMDQSKAFDIVSKKFCFKSAMHMV